MARVAKTTTSTKDVTEKLVEEKEKVVEQKDDKIEKELEKSKKENESMLKMIEQLQAQIQILATQNNNGGVVVKQNEDLTRLVKVTSLVNNTYNLTTEAYGRGKVFTFRKFGETKNIKFSELQDILTVYKKDFEMGRAVLGTKKDYEDLQIGYIYDEVLSAKEMKNIILLKDDKAVSTILEMDMDSQDNMASLIAQRLADGENCDYNKIKTLEDNGIEITKLVEQLKVKTEE